MAKPPRIRQVRGFQHEPDHYPQWSPWRLLLGIFCFIAFSMLFRTAAMPDLLLPGWASALTYLTGGLMGYAIGALHSMEIPRG